MFDDMCPCLLLYHIDALDAAKKNGKHKQLAKKIPELLYSSSRPVRCRQTRLQCLKTLLIKNALDKHFPKDDQTPPPPSPPPVEHADVIAVNVPGDDEQRPRAYIIFNDLRKSSTSVSTKVFTICSKLYVRNLRVIELCTNEGYVTLLRHVGGGKREDDEQVKWG